MIPKKVDADIDLNAKIDEDLKKSQEQQAEKIKKNRPKIAQAIGSKYFKVVVVVGSAVVIGYKMFFAPEPEKPKKKRNASKVEKVDEQKKLANASVGAKKAEEIQKKTDAEKNVTSLDSQQLSNVELLNTIAVPKLQLPKVPEVPKIDKITIKETIIENNNEQQTLSSNTLVNGGLNNKTINDNKNDTVKKNKNEKVYDPITMKPQNNNLIENSRFNDVKQKQEELKRKEEIKKMSFVDTNDATGINVNKSDIIKTQITDRDGNKVIVKEEKRKNKEDITQTPLSKQLAEEIFHRDEEKLQADKKNKKQQQDISNLSIQSLEQMFVMSGKGPTVNTQRSSSTNKNNFILFDGSSIQETSVVSDGTGNQNVNKLTNLKNTIVAGKIMEGVLAQAINSESAATIRAIISKDVYGENGNKILIPKGSSAYGSYATTISKTQRRLLLTWTKIIRPDGIVITMAADTYDQSGKKGIEGDIDTRYGELLKNSLLYSFVTLGTAIAVEKLTGIKNSTSITAGSTTVTNSPATAAVNSVIDSAKNIAEKMTDGLTDDLDPVISIPQGTIVHIISNADIVVPVAYKRMSTNPQL